MAALFEDEQWSKFVNDMLTRLKTDLHNHRMLANPWERAAHCMHKTWLNILRHQPKRPPQRLRRAPPRTWPEAAVTMLQALKHREYQRMVRTGWLRWASDRAQAGRLRRFAGDTDDVRSHPTAA
jgi:hypothetical protein